MTAKRSPNSKYCNWIHLTFAHNTTSNLYIPVLRITDCANSHRVQTTTTCTRWHGVSLLCRLTSGDRYLRIVNQQLKNLFFSTDVNTIIYIVHASNQSSIYTPNI